MLVKVLRPFLYSPTGIETVSLKEGQEVSIDPTVLQGLMNEGYVELKAQPQAPENKALPEAVENKAVEPAVKKTRGKK